MDDYSPIKAPLLPHERLVQPSGLSSPHSSHLFRSRRLAESQSSDSGSSPFPNTDNNLSDGSRTSSYDSNETLKMLLLPHEEFSPFGSTSSHWIMRKRRRRNARNNRPRPNPLLLERVQRAQHAPMLEPEVQYEQGLWFPSTSSIESSTAAVLLPPDNNQRHWGEFCVSPELMTPIDNEVSKEVRRSLQSLFDMKIFDANGNGKKFESSGPEGFVDVCANNKTEADIIGSLEEGYFPLAPASAPAPAPAPALEIQAQDQGEEKGKLKKSESLVSFKDLNVPPPRAPTTAPILALKRRVSFACETATGVVKGFQVAAKMTSLVGSLFDHLIEKGF